MNEDTRVVINCYAGDKHLITQKLDFYTHHECPVVTFSPEDSKVEIPGIESRFGGIVGKEGQLSLDRHDRQLEMLLEFPEKYFLFHDPDSVCVDPKIPDYLYAEPDTLWSNIIVDSAHWRQQGFYPEGFPKLAFQPPYFLFRETVAKLLSVAKGKTPINPALPLIDHYWVQLAVNARVTGKTFPDGTSHPISGDPAPGTDGGAIPAVYSRGSYDQGLNLAVCFTRNWGGNFFHAIKDAYPLPLLVEAHRLYLADGGDRSIPLPVPKEWDWLSEGMRDAVRTQIMAAAAER